MLRQVSRTRAAVRAVIGQRRALSVRPNTPETPKIEPIDRVKLPSSFEASSAAKSAALDVNAGGSWAFKVLILGLLSTPAAAALYVKQYPEWNPAVIKDDERWQKFRELVLGNEREQGLLVGESRSPDEFSNVISRGYQGVKKWEEEEGKKEEGKKEVEKKEVEKEKKQKKQKKEVEKKEETKKKKEKKEKGKKSKEKKKGKDGKEDDDQMKKKLTKAEKKAQKVAKKAVKAEKKAAQLKEEAESKKPVADKVKDKVHKVEEEVKKEVAAVAAVATTATTAVEKKVNAATENARAMIATLAGEANPEMLTHQMDKHIQATTVCRTY